MCFLKRLFNVTSSATLQVSFTHTVFSLKTIHLFGVTLDTPDIFRGYLTGRQLEPGYFEDYPITTFLKTKDSQVFVANEPITFLNVRAFS